MNYDYASLLNFDRVVSVVKTASVAGRKLKDWAKDLSLTNFPSYFMLDLPGGEFLKLEHDETEEDSLVFKHDDATLEVTFDEEDELEGVVLEYGDYTYESEVFKEGAIVLLDGEEELRATLCDPQIRQGEDDVTISFGAIARAQATEELDTYLYSRLNRLEDQVIKGHELPGVWRLSEIKKTDTGEPNMVQLELVYKKGYARTLDFKEALLYNKEDFRTDTSKLVVKFLNIDPRYAEEAKEELRKLLSDGTIANPEFGGVLYEGYWHDIKMQTFERAESSRKEFSEAVSILWFLSQHNNQDLYFKYQETSDAIKGHLFKWDATETTLKEVVNNTQFNSVGTIVTSGGKTLQEDVPGRKVEYRQLRRDEEDRLFDCEWEITWTTATEFSGLTSILIDNGRIESVMEKGFRATEAQVNTKRLEYATLATGQTGKFDVTDRRDGLYDYEGIILSTTADSDFVQLADQTAYYGFHIDPASATGACAYPGGSPLTWTAFKAALGTQMGNARIEWNDDGTLNYIVTTTGDLDQSDWTYYSGSQIARRVIVYRNKTDAEIDDLIAVGGWSTKIRGRKVDIQRIKDDNQKMSVTIDITTVSDDESYVEYHQNESTLVTRIGLWGKTQEEVDAFLFKDQKSEKIINGDFSSGKTGWTFNSGIEVPAITSAAWWTGSQITISGAGTAGANGTYTFYDMANNKPEFIKNARYSLYSSGTRWIIEDGETDILYRQTTNQEWPWLGVYEAVTGDAPAPATPSVNLQKTTGVASFWDGLHVTPTGAGTAEANEKCTFNYWGNGYPAFSGAKVVVYRISTGHWRIFRGSPVNANIYNATTATSWPWEATFEPVGTGVAPAPVVYGWGAFYVIDGSAMFYIPRGTPGTESPLILQEILNAQAGRKYIVSFKAKSDISGEVIRARLSNWNGSSWDQSADNVFIQKTLTTDWQTFSAELTANHSTKLRFLCGADDDENGGNVWVRNISVKEMVYLNEKRPGRTINIRPPQIDQTTGLLNAEIEIVYENSKYLKDEATTVATVDAALELEASGAGGKLTPRFGGVFLKKWAELGVKTRKLPVDSSGTIAGNCDTADGTFVHETTITGIAGPSIEVDEAGLFSWRVNHIYASVKDKLWHVWAIGREWRKREDSKAGSWQQIRRRVAGDLHFNTDPQGNLTGVNWINALSWVSGHAYPAGYCVAHNTGTGTVLFTANKSTSGTTIPQSSADWDAGGSVPTAWQTHGYAARYGSWKTHYAKSYITGEVYDGEHSPATYGGAYNAVTAYAADGRNVDGTIFTNPVVFYPTTGLMYRVKDSAAAFWASGAVSAGQVYKVYTSSARTVYEYRTVHTGFTPAQNYYGTDWGAKSTGGIVGKVPTTTAQWETFDEKFVKAVVGQEGAGVYPHNNPDLYIPVVQALSENVVWDNDWDADGPFPSAAAPADWALGGYESRYGQWFDGWVKSYITGEVYDGEHSPATYEGSYNATTAYAAVGNDVNRVVFSRPVVFYPTTGLMYRVKDSAAAFWASGAVSAGQVYKVYTTTAKHTYVYYTVHTGFTPTSDVYASDANWGIKCTVGIVGKVPTTAAQWEAFDESFIKAVIGLDGLGIAPHNLPADVGIVDGSGGYAFSERARVNFYSNPHENPEYFEAGQRLKRREDVVVYRTFYAINPVFVTNSRIPQSIEEIDDDLLTVKTPLGETIFDRADPNLTAEFKTLQLGEFLWCHELMLTRRGEWLADSVVTSDDPEDSGGQRNYPEVDANGYWSIYHKMPERLSYTGEGLVSGKPVGTFKDVG